MAAKKRKNRTVKKSSSHKKTANKKSNVVKKDVSPDYMIHLGEPKMVRKDLLECLREVILHIQGYERYVQLQEEKAVMMMKLKEDVKELKSLIDTHLHKLLPKGKLKAIHLEKKKEMPTPVGMVKPMMEAPNMPEHLMTMKPVEKQSESSHELRELEKQLNEIENQLRTIR